MNWSDVLEILKYILPSLVVMLTAYLILSNFLGSQKELKQLELRVENYKTSLPVRLQAYERLTIFLERISPNNLLQRVNKAGMNARDLQLALISNIRAEFEHNLAQQIYVSAGTWLMIVQVKEEIVSIVNRISADMPETATGKDLGRGVLEYFINNEQALPTQKALDTLKAEVRKVY
ncbi:MAG: hypothetical protein H0W62_08080 [Chitinophagales bacterium]|nr:hypothetical protein [Chitinophagales bacterium]